MRGTSVYHRSCNYDILHSISHLSRRSIRTEIWQFIFHTLLNSSLSCTSLCSLASLSFDACMILSYHCLTIHSINKLNSHIDITHHPCLCPTVTSKLIPSFLSTHLHFCLALLIILYWSFLSKIKWNWKKCTMNHCILQRHTNNSKIYLWLEIKEKNYDRFG